MCAPATARATAALATVLLLAGCDRDAGRERAGAPSTSSAPRSGGTAVIAGLVDLQSMDPLASDEAYARMLQRDVLFMPLLKYDADLEPTPWLAETWDTVRVAPDTLELTFHLRNDVRWHDGRPTTAEDVLFTFRRAMDPAVASSLAPAFAGYSPDARVVDARTIRFRFRPHAEFLDGWTQLPIAPAHLLAAVPPGQLRTHPFGTEHPVGDGPFRFVRRQPNQEWVFEANPQFPRELGGRPYLDRLVYRVIPDPNTLVTELLTGAVDVGLGVTAERAGQLRASRDVKLVSSAAPQWVFIAWNTRLPMFDTPEERRALTMAIDRRAIVDGLLHGQAEVGRSPVTPAHWAYDANDPRTSLPHDVAGARRLLAAAGWVDRDGDGILEDERNHEFRFTLKTPQGGSGPDVVQNIQAQLRPLGIEVRPSVLEGNTLIGQITGRVDGKGARERDFDAVVMGWVDDLRKDDSNFFHSRNLQGPFQISGFSNPRVDALLDTLQLVMDRRRARPLWREYEELMAQQTPQTVLFYPERLTGVSGRLRGVEIDRRGELATVAQWWIPPEARRGTDGGEGTPSQR